MFDCTLIGSESDLKVEAIYRSTLENKSALHLCHTAHFIPCAPKICHVAYTLTDEQLVQCLQNNRRAQVRGLLFRLHIVVRLALSCVGGGPCNCTSATITRTSTVVRRMR